MTNHEYKVFVSKTSTGEVWQITPKTYNFIDELNKESTATFTVGFEDLKKVLEPQLQTPIDIFSATFREIWIERDGSKIFWGVITDITIDPEGNGSTKITLKSISWFGLLGMRITTVPKRVFSAVDAGTIAWTLIDECQAAGMGAGANLGILQGAIDASKNRDRTYRFDIVKDQIIALSNNNLSDGFDFDIDMTKHFNVYYPTMGTNRLNLIFDMANTALWSFSKPLILSVTNRVHVIGFGQDDDVLYRTRDAADSYKNDWYLMEKTLQAREIIESTTLDDKGDLLLLLNQSPLINFRVEHYDNEIGWSDYNMGDNVKINFTDLGLINQTKRVIKRTFEMDVGKSIGYIKTYLR